MPQELCQAVVRGNFSEAKRQLVELSVDANLPIKWRVSMTPSPFFHTDTDLVADGVVEEEDYETRALHLAVLAGQPEMVGLLVDHGADVNELDSRGRCPILCAIFGLDTLRATESNLAYLSMEHSTHVDILAQHLLPHPRLSRQLLTDPREAILGLNMLCLAAYLDKIKCLQLLVDVGRVQPDIRDASEATALMYAARDGHTEAVDALLNRGASPLLLDKNGFSVFQHGQDYPDVIKLCETAFQNIDRVEERDLEDKDRQTKTLSQLLCEAFPAPPPTPSLPPPVPVPVLEKPALTIPPPPLHPPDPPTSESSLKMLRDKLNQRNRELGRPPVHVVTDFDSTNRLTFDSSFDSEQKDSEEDSDTHRMSIISSESDSILAKELHLDILRSNLQEIDLDYKHIEQRWQANMQQVKEAHELFKELEGNPQAEQSERSAAETRWRTQLRRHIRYKKEQERLATDRKKAVEHIREAVAEIRKRHPVRPLEWLLDEIKDNKRPESMSTDTSFELYEGEKAELLKLIEMQKQQLYHMKLDISQWKRIAKVELEMRKNELDRARQVGKDWDEGRAINAISTISIEESDIPPVLEPHSWQNMLEDMHRQMMLILDKANWQRDYVADIYSREMLSLRERNEKLMQLVLDQVRERLSRDDLSDLVLLDTNSRQSSSSERRMPDEEWKADDQSLKSVESRDEEVQAIHRLKAEITVLERSIALKNGQVLAKQRQVLSRKRIEYRQRMNQLQQMYIE